MLLSQSSFGGSFSTSPVTARRTAQAAPTSDGDRPVRILTALQRFPSDTPSARSSPSWTGPSSVALVVLLAGRDPSAGTIVRCTIMSENLTSKFGVCVCWFNIVA